MATKKVLVLTLQTFSSTGGIQKMSLTMAHALQQIIEKRNWEMKLLSAYDSNEHLYSGYIKADQFKGFNKNRVLFALDAIIQGLKSDVLILTHINLALVGWLIKLFNPTCKVWLIAHGIEVWRPLGFFKKQLLNCCNKIICVSQFTKKNIIDLHQVDSGKCTVLNNTLDPNINLPNDFTKPVNLFKRYQLTNKNKILFTLTRLSSAEQYKGYEQVIKAVSKLKLQFPEIKYILAGKYDTDEAKRVNSLIQHYNIQENVIVTGFLDKNELNDHFLLADIFVLPSKREGFGIVIIEALSHGLPVICGNKDGSLDAIRNGELGKAINPDSIDELIEAIIANFKTPPTFEDRKSLQKKCLQMFGANSYQKAIEGMLID